MKKTAIFFSSLFFLSSCSLTQKETEENIIYTSFYPIYDFTKRIVKDKFSVINLTPYGAEPHDYEPTARNVVEMTKAKALFMNGLGLESYASSLPKDFEKKTYVVTKNIKTISIDNTIDPHVWLSLPNAIQEMKNILEIVQDIDPDNSSYYQCNYEEEEKKFLDLKKEYSLKMGELENRYLVVSHAAFAYLCQDYDLVQISVNGLSPDQEPTAKDMEKILSAVKEYHISTIFYEELVSDEISKKIAEETGAKTEMLSPLEGMSEEDMKTKDYLSVMRENYDKIIGACHD